MKTIDTYYEPVVDACPGWSNFTRRALSEILDREFSQAAVDAAGATSALARAAANRQLLAESLGVSGACAGALLLLVGGLVWKKVPVPWVSIVVENVMMVMLLGLYEFFFFRGIIYNYTTISTPELNAYILDGLWSCLGNGKAH